jgi:hypothetical protein
MFVPASGDYFDILIADDLSGDFNGFDFGLAQLASGLYWTHQIFNRDDGAEVYRLAVAGSTGGGDVPEPGTLVLMMLGMLILGWNASRYGRMRQR